MYSDESREVPFSWQRIARRLLLAAVLALAAVLLTGALTRSAHSGAGSPEVKFTDASESGLAIVPASCPSFPHFQGQCGIPCRLTLAGGGCQCPPGYVQQGGYCISTACPAGYTFINGGCVLTSCPSGQVLVNGRCVSGCGNVCSGGSIVNSCTGALVRSCAYGCSGNSCNPTPAPSIVAWRVSPLLVQSRSTVTVTWSASNVSSCTVTGTNGDGTGNNATGVWSGNSGTKISSPIVGQTVYTIVCQGLADAIPSSVSASATVNIVPVFQEQ